MDRPSDANLSFKHYLPPLSSPVAAVATLIFEICFVAALAQFSVCTCYSLVWLTCENTVHREFPLLKNFRGCHKNFTTNNYYGQYNLRTTVAVAAFIRWLFCDT